MDNTNFDKEYLTQTQTLQKFPCFNYTTWTTDSLNTVKHTCDQCYWKHYKFVSPKCQSNCISFIYDESLLLDYLAICYIMQEKYLLDVKLPLCVPQKKS